MPPIVCRLPVDAVECPIQWRERMSSLSSGPGQLYYYSQQYQHYQSTWSLNDLSTELLSLIFLQVRFFLFFFLFLSSSSSSFFIGLCTGFR